GAGRSDPGERPRSTDRPDGLLVLAGGQSIQSGRAPVRECGGASASRAPTSWWWLELRARPREGGANGSVGSGGDPRPPGEDPMDARAFEGLIELYADRVYSVALR